VARELVLAERSNPSTTHPYLLSQCSGHRDGKVSPTRLAGKSQQYFTKIHEMLTEILLNAVQLHGSLRSFSTVTLEFSTVMRSDSPKKPIFAQKATDGLFLRWKWAFSRGTCSFYSL
jgi:hypothetical protein